MRANDLAFFVCLFWQINLPVGALRIRALQGGNVKSHPVLSGVSSMLTFKLWLKQVCRGVCLLSAEWNWQGCTFCSHSATAAAAFGGPAEAPWTEKSAEGTALSRSHSGFLTAPTRSVSALIALVCILLFCHPQFLPTYFKNM